MALLAPAAVAACAADGAGPDAAGAALRSVVLFTWDTTRADRLGSYGHAVARTPTFDTLATRGALYLRAYAASPVTLPSHTTILTGTYPCAHGVRDNAIFQAGDGARLLSEALQEQGFATAAFVGTFVLDPKFGLAQGFDVYDAPDVTTIGLGWNVIERPADQVTQSALRWIDALKADQRFFLWVHYYDPHAPHEALPGERGDAAAEAGRDEYDTEITRCDAHTRTILDRLAARGLDQGLLTLITADHGESHGDHGEMTHGNFVYDATMRVPLAMAPPPAGALPGARLETPVSTVDLAGTILARLGLDRGTLPEARTPPLPADDDADGADAAASRAIWLEALTPYFSHRWHGLRAVVWNGFKYIAAPRPELYRIGDERENLHATEAETATRLAARLAALEREHPPLGWEAAGDLSSEDMGHLQALGYAAAGVIGGDPIDPSLPDPKDRIGDLKKLDQVTIELFTATRLLKLDVALRTGRVQPVAPEQRQKGVEHMARARALLAEIRAANPEDPFLDQVESQILLNLDRPDEAAPMIERALLRAPRNMPLRYNLAVAYSRTGRMEMAIREMEKAITIERRSLQGRRWLVQATVNLRDWPAAAWWLDELATMPGQTEADHEGIRRARARVATELQKSGGAAPRPPAPVAEAELMPEALRQAVPGDGS